MKNWILKRLVAFAIFAGLLQVVAAMAILFSQG